MMGQIESIEGEIALVRCNKRLVEVEVKRLRTNGQQSQVTEFVEAMIDSAKK